LISFGNAWPRGKKIENVDDLMEFALEHWPTAREVTVNVRSTNGKGFGASHGIYSFVNQKAANTGSFRSFICGKVSIF
jgi:hypothetical protein